MEEFWRTLHVQRFLIPNPLHFVAFHVRTSLFSRH